MSQNRWRFCRTHALRNVSSTAVGRYRLPFLTVKTEPKELGRAGAGEVGLVWSQGQDRGAMACQSMKWKPVWMENFGDRNALHQCLHVDVTPSGYIAGPNDKRAIRGDGFVDEMQADRCTVAAALRRQPPAARSVVAELPLVEVGD